MSTVPNLESMTESMDSLVTHAEAVVHSEPAQKVTGWFKGIVTSIQAWRKSEETLSRFNKASREIALWEKAPAKWYVDKASGDLFTFVPEIEADYLLPKIQETTQRLGFAKNNVTSYATVTRSGHLAGKFNDFERPKNSSALKEAFPSSFGKTKITVKKRVASDPAFIRDILENHTPQDRKNIPDIAEAWISTGKDDTYPRSR